MDNIGGSFYDDFAGNEAPMADKPLVREPGWQASNNERFKKDLPDHVSDAMTVTQADHSYYAFTRFAFGHPPRDNFESQVNKAHKNQFGDLVKGFVFPVERDKYMKFYRGMME
jgi:hypothetical protein